MKPCLLLSGTELHLEQNERTNISTLDIAVIGSRRMYSLGLAVDEADEQQETQSARAQRRIRCGVQAKVRVATSVISRG